MLSKTDSSASRPPSQDCLLMGNWGWWPRWTLHRMSLPPQPTTCVCLRADRQTTAGWMPILHIYNYNYRSDMVAVTDITFSSVIKMGKYSPTSRFSSPTISPKLAPLFRAFRVIRALFCTPPAAYVVLRLLRSSSSVIFGVDNDTAGSAILLPLPPRLNFFLVHLTHICPHLSWDRRCRGKI